MIVSDNTNISVILVDDEKKACTNLKNLLLNYVDPGIIIAGMSFNTHEAEKQINTYKPDAVFLDIEMPNENAFNFLERISPINFEIVFVTSYDEYAVRAFKLNAVDYILKPISIAELKNTVQKLKEKIDYKKIITQKQDPGADYIDIANQINNKIVQHKIIVKSANEVEAIDFKDICFIEAQSSYCKIVFIKNNIVKEVVMGSPLSDYEELLPVHLFYRIHRSYLINCIQVQKISSEESCMVVMNDKTPLPVSRRRYGSFIEFLKKNEHYYD